MMAEEDNKKRLLYILDMMKKTDELFAYLEKAIKYTPEETKDFIGHLFPPDMNPEDYLAYLRNKFDIF